MQPEKVAALWCLTERTASSVVRDQAKEIYQLIDKVGKRLKKNLVFNKLIFSFICI